MTANTDETVASAWFGTAFTQLHPRLQSSHRHGGRLRGPVSIAFGRGLAGAAGRRLAGRLGIPAQAEEHQLEVTTSHHDDLLHWDRRFDERQKFASTFLPVGHWPDGCWIEQTAVIALKLQVDIIDGGWHRRCVGAQRGRWHVSRWLLPRSEAFKRIEEDRYRFSVGFALPLPGEVLRYGGLPCESTFD